jgi:hypothetical protein
MERKKVQSSIIQSIGYDPVAEILEIEFHLKKGQSTAQIYRYRRFSPADWQDFKQAESIGKHFLLRIRDVFECERLPAAEKAACVKPCG